MKNLIKYKILTAFVFLLLVTILVLNFFVGVNLKKYYDRRISGELSAKAVLVSDILKDDLVKLRHNRVNYRVEELSGNLGVAISVYDDNGNVVASSDISMPERSAQRSATATVEDLGRIAGTVKITASMSEVEEELFFLRRAFFFGAVIAVITAMLFGYFISRNISKPIREIEEVARSMAKGDLSRRIRTGTSDEIGMLAASLNRMADELQTKMDNLEKMDQIRTDFVANVSHELKTPLTLIKGFVETLEDGAIEDKDNARRFLGIIRDHTERLSNIINDLLSLAEIEGKKGEISISQLDMKYVLDEVVWSFEHLRNSKCLKIKVDYTGSNFRMKGDKNKIEQVLFNLLDNAIKYTPAKGEIMVSLFEQTDSIMVSIEDTGIGIPASDLERIFERFYRVDKARSRRLGGTGLGLAIVKHIILLHNGHIDIDSEAGKGTKVSVILPREQSVS